MTTSPELRFVPLPSALPPGTADEPSCVRVVADAPNAFPCRRCLRDGDEGDELLLVSYDPFVGSSPYRQPGPIYVHAAHCAPRPEDLVSAPDQLTRRTLSVRAFDSRHLMVGAVITDGPLVEDVAARLLADPDVEYLHVHNAAPGCFAVRVERVWRGGRA